MRPDKTTTKKERPVLVSFQKLHRRFCRHAIGVFEIASRTFDSCEGLRALVSRRPLGAHTRRILLQCLDVHRLVPRRGIVVVGSAGENLRRNAHVVDLADAAGQVAVVAEQLRHGHHIGQVFAQVTAVAEHAVGVRIEPGHHRCSRGATDWILAVHVLKTNASFRQFIETRCLALRMPETTQGRVQIIRHKQDDVGRAVFGAGQRDTEDRRQQEGQ